MKINCHAFFLVAVDFFKEPTLMTETLYISDKDETKMLTLI